MYSAFTVCRARRGQIQVGEVALKRAHTKGDDFAELKRGDKAWPAMAPPRRILVALLATGFALAACGAAVPSGESGVRGHVWIGPMCPVVQEGVECPDQPIEADLEVQDSRGRVVARSRSNVDGEYRIALAPGSYMLVPLSPAVGLPFASPLPLTIEDGRWSEVDVFYDSGIR